MITSTVGLCASDLFVFDVKTLQEKLNLTYEYCLGGIVVDY